MEWTALVSGSLAGALVAGLVSWLTVTYRVKHVDRPQLAIQERKLDWDLSADERKARGEACRSLMGALGQMNDYINGRAGDLTSEPPAEIEESWLRLHALAEPAMVDLRIHGNDSLVSVAVDALQLFQHICIVRMDGDDPADFVDRFISAQLTLTSMIRGATYPQK